MCFLKPLVRVKYLALLCVNDVCIKLITRCLSYERVYEISTSTGCFKKKLLVKTTRQETTHGLLVEEHMVKLSVVLNVKMNILVTCQKRNLLPVFSAMIKKTHRIGLNICIYTGLSNSTSRWLITSVVELNMTKVEEQNLSLSIWLISAADEHVPVFMYDIA